MDSGITLHNSKFKFSKAEEYFIKGNLTTGKNSWRWQLHQFQNIILQYLFIEHQLSSRHKLVLGATTIKNITDTVSLLIELMYPERETDIDQVYTYLATHHSGNCPTELYSFLLSPTSSVKLSSTQSHFIIDFISGFVCIFCFESKHQLHNILIKMC